MLHALRLGLLIVASSFSLAAQAVPIVFTTTMTGANESPPNASPGTGFATVTFDLAAHSMRVQVTFSGLLGTTTASHIHVINGPGDANTADTLGPVATTTPSFVGFPLGVTSGSMDQTYDMTLAGTYRAGFITDAGGIAAAELALYNALLTGRAYLNVHSTFAPGGEIRGFLAVPEPGTLVLMTAGLAALAYVQRRRRVAIART